jgi:1,4-alpha-glucan branching enzyme
MFAQPGKKLLFMGSEFGQEREWNHDSQLDWELLTEPLHQGAATLVRDLNQLYRSYPSLHRYDESPEGFEWIDATDVEQSVLSFIRKGAEGEQPVVAIFNFTPIPRYNYRVGVPHHGFWRELLNSDAEVYGGSGEGNMGGVEASPLGYHNHLFSLSLTLPPLSALFFVPSQEEK